MAIVGGWVPLEKNVLAGMAAPLIEDIGLWRDRGLRAAVARVVELDRPGPGPAPALAVNERGEVAGSLAGRPPDAAVVAEALDVLQLGRPRLVSFHLGGAMHVLFEPVDG